jgi:ADP-heptose:LPS heptosyltransferase
MTTNKKLGIWMDHSNAHLIEFAGDTSETIASKFTHEQKEASLHKGEHLMHNKENHEQSEYYKELSKAIMGYDDVLLFGPTEAKSELANMLQADHRFAKIKVRTESADKMSDNQQHAFVKDFFTKHI